MDFVSNTSISVPINTDEWHEDVNFGGIGFDVNKGFFIPVSVDLTMISAPFEDPDIEASR